MKINKNVGLCLFGMTVMFALVLFENRHVYADATCVALTAEQSEDKNYYTFKATASTTSNTTIIGYEFDFGDQQSYRFAFQNSPNKNKNSATVKHTYQKSHNYTTTVNVISSTSGKETKTTSPNCIAKVAMEQTSVAELPTTGPSDAFILQALILGAVTYTATLRITKKP